MGQSFLQNCKKKETDKFMFYVVAFDPILDLDTLKARQNNRLHLNFVKDFNVVRGP